jgi:hypothetical protein
MGGIGVLGPRADECVRRYVTGRGRAPAQHKSLCYGNSRVTNLAGILAVLVRVWE